MTDHSASGDVIRLDGVTRTYQAGAPGDGGASWPKATFAVQPLASSPQGDWQMAVGEIACPAVDSRSGIGAVGQGSSHAAVYTSAGS